jgi:virginiamycin A acetyltransferase
MKSKNNYKTKRKKSIIQIGKNVFMPSSTKISVPELIVDDFTRINGPITIRGQENCQIGKYCGIGYNNTIITTNHDISKANLQLNFQRKFGFENLEISKGPVIIGNNVWIGDNVTILSGVSIGDGSIIGAGTVVDRSFDACSIIRGNPGRLIMYRFNNRIIKEFTKLAWWNWSENKIERNKKFFETDLANFSGPSLSELIK